MCVAQNAGARHRAGVRADAGGQVDGDGRDGEAGQVPGQQRHVVGQSGPAADAQHPVDGHVGLRSQRRLEPLVDDQIQVVDVDQTAAGGPERGQPACVRLPEAADRRHGGPRRASRAPANSASPPLLPGPVRTMTRVP